MNGNGYYNDEAVDMQEVQGYGKGNKNGNKRNEKTGLRTPTDIYEHPSFYSFILDMPDLDALNIKTLEYLSDKQKYSNLVDPSLKSSKNDDLEIICEVINECIVAIITENCQTQINN